MTKQRDIVWHKRRGKFIPSAQQRSRTAASGLPPEDNERQLSRKEQFLKDLALEVHKAVRKSK